jgi:predicted Fe-S protein YdhL (DUF1289 family)
VNWTEMTTSQKNAYISRLEAERLAREAAAETGQDEEGQS